MARFLFSLALMLLLNGPASAAPDAELIPGWDAFQPDNPQSLDHSDWQAFLNAYLRQDAFGQTYFSYSDVSDADAERLDRYLGHLGRVHSAGLNRAEQMAYWINLYNAATVRVVLDHYPVDTIRKIMGGWFNTGPWDEPLVTVGDDKLSLNDIEHGILRPIWQDPRIHYVLNCASLGCPNLNDRVFTASTLEEQLETAAFEFINHQRGVRFESNTLILSSIYTWYAGDFGATREELIGHLLTYAKPKLRARLDGYQGRITYDYDWLLNEVN